MPAARVTEVGALAGRGALAPMLSTLMTRPHFRCFMCGQASRVSRMAANSLRSRSSCHCSSVTVSNGWALEVPALFTSISICPNACLTFANPAAISSARRTSQTTGSAFRPDDASIAEAASSNGPCWRAMMAMSAPASANMRAIARPRPLLPPVMRAFLPVNLMSIVASTLPLSSSAKLVARVERTRNPGAALRVARPSGFRGVHRARPSGPVSGRPDGKLRPDPVAQSGLQGAMRRQAGNDNVEIHSPLTIRAAR